MTSPQATLITSEQVSERLHLSLGQIDEMRFRGAPVRVVGGELRWDLAALIDWLGEHEPELWSSVLP